MSNHIRFPCFEIEQGSQTRLYLGALRFEELIPLITVSPREPRTDDPYFADTPDVGSTYPQRPEKEDRLREIAKFVEQRLTEEDSRKQVIFPNAVILGLLTDCEVQEQELENLTPTAAILITGEEQGVEQSVDGKCKKVKTILLPKRESSLFVIDGQHRIKGIKHLFERLQKETREKTKFASEELTAKERLLQKIRDFEIPISLLIDFDLEEQAMVFADVNFNQKPVPRSFYYDIFGAFESDKVTPISFTHEFVVHLTNGKSSPLKGMIKLLGTGPGFVSQAFMVERIVPLVDAQMPKSVLRTFFLLREKGDIAASRLFAKIVVNFFLAVKEEFAYAWPEKDAEDNFNARDYEFILVKSMVMSGLLGILREIYKLSLLDFANDQEAEVASSNAHSKQFFAELLRDIDIDGRKNPSKSVFSNTSKWAVGGSGKVEKTIFEALRSNLFTAYLAAAKNQNSIYSETCSRFHGERQAARIAQNSELTSQQFWSQTEALWKSREKIL